MEHAKYSMISKAQERAQAMPISYKGNAKQVMQRPRYIQKQTKKQDVDSLGCLSVMDSKL